MGHEGQVLMNGIRAFVEETPESVSALSPMGRYTEKMAIREPDSRLSPDTESAAPFISDFSASRTLRNKCLMWISHSVCGPVLQQPEGTETRFSCVWLPW